MKQAGFSLLETLVAMALVGILALAALRVSHQSVENAAHVEERTLAMMVASNYLLDLQQAGAWPEGTLSHQLLFAGREWHISAEVQDTAQASLRRLSIRVAQDTPPALDAPIILFGFVGRY